jgi:tRNA modification GTPase
MDERSHDSIAAIATPPGAGALAIVRVSGPDAVAIGDRVFRGTAPLGPVAGYTVHYGSIVGTDDERFDEVLVTVFRSPRSYTGEDMIEISCHGGLFVTREVLRVVLAAGARPALPGEFTRRAFLSGRIDLSQAEAVADVIASRSRRGHRVSLEQLAGRLGDAVRLLRTEMMDLCALLELELDFSEEGLALISVQDVERRINTVLTRIDALLASYVHGRVYRDGVSVVLAGEPNAGKSSVFNALLRQDRAIVTPVPGTTRDALEESIVIDGILFRLTDTAGLRETSDQVEQLGVERSRSAVSGADVVLHVMDASVSASVSAHLDRMSVHTDEQHFVPVLNKCDLLPSWPAPEKMNVDARQMESVVPVSAQTGQGLDVLRARLAHVAAGDTSLGADDVCITSERHREALGKARASLDRAVDGLRSGSTEEYLALDIREAASALAEITGEVSSEEVLNHVFERFCIGK